VVLARKVRARRAAYASLVTYVHDDNMVNLVAFTTDGVPFPAGSVAIVQDGSPYVAGDLPYAEWMPYQVGQARKHATTKPSSRCPRVTGQTRRSPVGSDT